MDGKRAVDLVVGTVALLVTLPITVTVAIAVRLRVGSPVLFRQVRPGLRGEPFELVKFRTMAEARDGRGVPLPDEARIVPFGQKLRSTSLDELPELWNVVRGDMSLVGPRPLLVEYLPALHRTQARRHEVRPGITGWAQVNGRNAPDWETKLEMDVWYVENRSLSLDLRILLRTLRVTLLGDGISRDGHATSPKFTGPLDRRADRDASVSYRILLSPPHLDGEERELLLDAFDSNWVAPLGPHVDAFEGEIAAVAGAGTRSRCRAAPQRCTSPCSPPGSAAATTCSCPTLTFAATANAVMYVGARPVFVDATPTSWNIDPELVAERAAIERADRGRAMPAAIITVDLYGQCADYEPRSSRSAAGTASRSSRTPPRRSARPTGAARPASFGRSAVFSFNGNKIITTSGGGMLVTDDAAHRRPRPPPGHAGARAGRALRAPRGRLQLPALATCSPRSAAASSPASTRRSPAAAQINTALPRRARRPAGHRRSCRSAEYGDPTGG